MTEPTVSFDEDNMRVFVKDKKTTYSVCLKEGTFQKIKEREGYEPAKSEPMLVRGILPIEKIEAEMHQAKMRLARAIENFSSVAQRLEKATKADVDLWWREEQERPRYSGMIDIDRIAVDR